MKYIVLFLMPIFLLAQNGSVQQMQFSIDGTPTYISPDSADFNMRNKFSLGWHWSEDSLTSRLFNSSFLHTWVWANYVHNNPLKYPENADLNLRMSYFANDPIVPSHSESIQWEPTLLVSEPEEFGYSYEEDDGAQVFGFQNIKSDTIIDGKLILKTTGNNIDSIILSENSFSDQLKFNGKLNGSGGYINPGFNGISSVPSSTGNNTDLYFTINLRRLDSTDNTKNTDGVLEIKLPYFLENGTTGYIKFDSIPASSIANNYTPMNVIGSCLELQQSPSKPTSFTITKEMLPSINDNLTNDITISGFFVCENDDDNNYPLDKSLFLDEIKHLKIEIKYLGNLDVAIDWVRIESHAAQWTLRGEFNDEIKTVVEDVFTYFAGQGFKDRGIRATRIYGRDEFDIPSWRNHRYLNNLVGGIVTTETDRKYSFHFEKYIGMAEKWFINGGDSKGASNPYIRTGLNFDGYNIPYVNKSLNLGNGYSTFIWDTGQNKHVLLSDTLVSGYETFLRGIFNHNGTWTYDRKVMLPINSLDSIIEIADSTINWDFYTNVNSYQLTAERFPSSIEREQNTHFLWSDKPWFAQNQQRTDLHYDLANSKAFIFAQTFKTSEMIRANIYRNLMLGAKGIMIDGPVEDKKYSGQPAKPNTHFSTLLTYGENYLIDSNITLQGWDLIRYDGWGPDFVKENDYREINQVIHVDSCAKSFKISRDRIYLGQRSNRVELKKTFDWVRHNEQELVDLRLQAWHSKGFDRYYFQHPKYDVSNQFNILRFYVNSDSIKTRRLFRPNYDGDHNYNPTDHEHSDSSFFELTLLEHKDTSLARDGYGTFYLGIQNRRTDPLIFVEDSTNSPINRELQFFSGAEFDEFVLNGGEDLFGIFRDSTWWQEQWWRRLGAREITIPFDFKP